MEHLTKVLEFGNDEIRGRESISSMDYARSGLCWNGRAREDGWRGERRNSPAGWLSQDPLELRSGLEGRMWVDTCCIDK